MNRTLETYCVAAIGGVALGASIPNHELTGSILGALIGVWSVWMSK